MGGGNSNPALQNSSARPRRAAPGPPPWGGRFAPTPRSRRFPTVVRNISQSLLTDQERCAPPKSHSGRGSARFRLKRSTGPFPRRLKPSPMGRALRTHPEVQTLPSCRARHQPKTPRPRGSARSNLKRSPGSFPRRFSPSPRRPLLQRRKQRNLTHPAPTPQNTTAPSVLQVGRCPPVAP